MRVTHITTRRTSSHVTFTADFIFERPYGGKKKKLLSWLKWLLTACLNPRDAWRFGFSVRRRVWYRFPKSSVKTHSASDAFFLLALPLALATNENLIFEGEVSLSILKRSAAVQQYYQEVARRKIEITAVQRKKPVDQFPHSTIAQFFTLGVDSFYTLCCYPKGKSFSPRTLLYVDGYDIPFYQKRFLKKIHLNIHAVARQTHSHALLVETNLREVSDAIIGWGRFHVTALVAVATFLPFRKVLISGESFEAADWGLRAGVDTLYTTPARSIQLVAHNVSREKKIRGILNSSHSDLFLNRVRVCWENVRLPHLPYNCSTCQKCLKTQLTLLSLGVVNPPTFLPLNVPAVEKLQLVGHVWDEWSELFLHLQKDPHTPHDLLCAIEKVLKKPLRV